MKQFSKAWKASKNRAKQRKYRANAPLHTAASFRSARLSDALAKAQGVKQAPIRVGDEVKILRGVHKGKTGEVSAIHPYKRERVMIQGFEVERRDGQKRQISFHASNLMITDIEQDDRRFSKASPKTPKKSTKSKTKTAASKDAKEKSTEKSGQESDKE